MWVEITGRALGGGLGVMLSIRDISRRKSAEDRLEEANRNLLMLASTDGLTGLANRRSFDKVLARELARCARDGLPLALLLVDVDHFKSYNDSYGHQEGDECLKRLSHLLRGMARRPGDVAARYGGEEFAVILPNTSADGGYRFAESLRISVEALNIPHCRSSYGIVTVSIGLVCEIPIGGGDGAMLQHADAALYAAKATDAIAPRPTADRRRTSTRSVTAPERHPHFAFHPNMPPHARLEPRCAQRPPAAALSVPLSHRNRAHAALCLRKNRSSASRTFSGCSSQTKCPPGTA